MMYLLDANVLIRADADFYPLDQIPQFWEWLIKRGDSGEVKIPLEIHAEIAVGAGHLSRWVRENDVKTALLLNEKPDSTLVRHVLNAGFQRSRGAENRSGRLPCGLCAGRRRTGGRNREVSKPNKRFGARKLPDVCDDCNVKWTNDFEMYRMLNFNLQGRWLAPKG